MGSGGEGQERRERTEEAAAAEISVSSREEENPRESEIFFIIRGPSKRRRHYGTRTLVRFEPFASAHTGGALRKSFARHQVAEAAHAPQL